MAFAFKDHRSDKHGQWVPIHYDGMLTAQIFFGKNSPEDQRFSFFWLGAVEPSWISDFVDAMASTSESEVFGRMVTAYGVNQFALAPNLDLVSDKKSLRIPWDRNHFSKIINCTIFPASIGMNITNIPSPNHPRKPFSLYLWATIEPGVRPKDDKIYDTDVGIKVRYYDWVKSGVQKAIFPLFLNSSRVTPKTDEVLTLLGDVTKLASGHYYG